MKLLPNTALGIDVSARRISLALLKHSKGGLELLRCASAPVPEGAIINGNIEKPALLARTVKELQSRNKMHTSKTAIALFARPLLQQIVDLPKQTPKNIKQFIENEVKNYVILPAKEIAFDFRGIDSKGRGGENRLFIAAADGKKVNEIARAFSSAGFDVAAIEPALTAYARAFFARKIAGKFDCNVLMAIAENDNLTFCVFRNQSLDFVRTEYTGDHTTDAEKLSAHISSQINTIIQFYDIEVSESPRKWDGIVVVGNSPRLSNDAKEALASSVKMDDLQIISDDNVLEQIEIIHKSSNETAGASAVAIGLAMRLLEQRKDDLSVNLLPQAVVDERLLKKDTLISANIWATVLLIMILIVVWLSLAIGKVNRQMTAGKQKELSEQIRSLLKQQQSTDSQITLVSHRLEELNGILHSRQNPNWHDILKNISDGTPKSVRITRLSAAADRNILLEGYSLSYKAVYLFMDMLNKSDHITKASLQETKKETKGRGLIRYKISCSLNKKKESS